MNRRYCAVLAMALCAVLLAGCVPEDLPTGDRDEIGSEVQSEAVSGPVGWKNASSRQPCAVGSGFEPDPRPAFVTLDGADGPAAGGEAEMAGIAETDGLMWLDGDGTCWIDCEALNRALGENLIQEDDAGNLFVRSSLRVIDDFVWDLDEGRLLVRLDVLSDYCGTSGLDDDEPASPGIVPGDKVDDRDRPVLDAVLEAMGEQEAPRAVVFSFGLCGKYAYDGIIYIRSDDSVSTDMIPQDPDGTVFDGRRVWHDREDSVLIDACDGNAIYYYPMG